VGDPAVGARLFTNHQLRQWEEFHKVYPGWRKRWDLIAEYAQSRGGLTLRYWRLKAGPAFGERTWYSPERCAEELGISFSDVVRIHMETTAWVRPRLEADPDWQELQRNPPPPPGR
jgi:hypothetical protein